MPADTDNSPPSVFCDICPKSCQLHPGQRGDCRIRANVDGQVSPITYGRPCSIQVDPIEKKPFFHYYPGTKILSLATVGCNLHCLNCQNREISQGNPEEQPTYDLPPVKVPLLAKAQVCPAVAYTYTEPLVCFEYTYDCSVACREAGIRNAIVTAGYVNPDPLRRLCRVLDAATLDIKAMSDKFYREVCGASLAPVLRTVEILKEEGVYLELSNLVIPTLNDSDAMLRDLCRWVKSHVGAETPFHFLRFFPRHRLTDQPPTPAATLLRARDIARAEGLRHVYLGNLDVPGGEDTACAACGAVLIRRRHYAIVGNRVQAGQCPDCGHPVNGRWK
ncbi:MAG: AmmeMemoRadiSam system radical SAM enzyme [Kiritimatiellia bacterium]